MYALKVLASLGLAEMSLDVVCRATLVARMRYASPCWWGAISAAEQMQLQGTLNRAARWRLCVRPPPSLLDLCGTADRGFFSDVLSDPSHLL